MPLREAQRLRTPQIPIVFARIGDPIGSGLVPSLSRPGGNLTGVSILSVETGAKRLELLISAVPSAKHVGALWNPNFPMSDVELRGTEEAARSLNVDLISVEVRGPDDFESALRGMFEQRANAVIVGAAACCFGQRQRLAELAVTARLPTMSIQREVVEAGGLMSYGTREADMYRRATAHVGKILKGAQPADIPVEQPTKFELVINLKTAKALGLKIPQMLLLRADEVLE